ncbi:helix-turn-helix transcriptional regulator [Afifella aestuarii]|uniref:helix-turn-helix transcriptional regulator n=1 Tax=Afifella aestuarii TaxID=1909496 RepID=UPI000FE3397C|nr:helix-turn-helix transcriptional regulator [Afifella aestuarii]
MTRGITAVPPDDPGTGILYDLIGRCIEEIGDDSFAERLAELLETRSSYDSLVVSAFFPDLPPRQLFSDLSKSDAARTLEPYFSFAYLLDPWYLMFCDGVEDGVYRLADQVPDDFFESEYYIDYYSRTRLTDESGVFIWLDGGVCLVLSLGRRFADSEACQADASYLTSIFTCTRSLCRQHWKSLEPNPAVAQAGLATIQASARHFGRDSLSKREHQIVHLMLRGHSSKSMARIIGISPETVKVYRKRVHKKLGISSQAQLFSLFLSALESGLAEEGEDPLKAYRRRVGDDDRSP